MGLRPQKYSPVAEKMSYAELYAGMQRYAIALETFVKKLPTHDQFIRDNCSAF
jgi:tryptophan 7-halogenase